MFHYVYQIKNKINGKMYIGSRTSNIEPKDDLGKKIKEAKEVLFDEIKKRFELSDDLYFKSFNDITDALALANCIKETKMKKKPYKKNGIKLFEYVPIFNILLI
jgi:predicted GIY-YIG superfamily endonuclease